jgi:hypothetical protein
MTWINDTKSKTRLPAKLAAGLAISAALVLGTADPVSAQYNQGYHHYDQHHNWNRGYYRAPPVVYPGYGGYGYYPPPPVVYGPGIGINLPFIGIGIR